MQAVSFLSGWIAGSNGPLIPYLQVDYNVRARASSASWADLAGRLRYQWEVPWTIDCRHGHRLTAVSLIYVFTFLGTFFMSFMVGEVVDRLGIGIASRSLRAVSVTDGSACRSV